MFEPADVIYVNAGATRPADAWLDRLKEREADRAVDGRRISEPRRAARSRVPDRAAQPGILLRAGSLGFAIFPCEGGCDEASGKVWSRLSTKGGRAVNADHKVQSEI
jgi:protein-L-isoaspartate(D-aspartate) O-methyltransferase